MAGVHFLLIALIGVAALLTVASATLMYRSGRRPRDTELPARAWAIFGLTYGLWSVVFALRGAVFASMIFGVCTFVFVWRRWLWRRHRQV
jgi:hypothetical protein